MVIANKKGRLHISGFILKHLVAFKMIDINSSQFFKELF